MIQTHAMTYHLKQLPLICKWQYNQGLLDAADSMPGLT